MSLHFYSYARKGYEFIDDVARKLKITDTDKAGRMARCVFRALRNGLTTEESFEFLAQLPMALKSIYVDGWKLSTGNKKISQLTDFISEVIKEDNNSAWHDFLNDHEVMEAIVAVFKVLIHHVTVPESEFVFRILPDDLKVLLKTEITN